MANIITSIKKWFRQRRHAKEYKKIQDGLLSNPKLLFATKEKFEKAFGVNSQVRTADQWTRLVRVYGIEQVCVKEHMTKEQVELRCKETFSQRLKRTMKPA